MTQKLPPSQAPNATLLAATAAAKARARAASQAPAAPAPVPLLQWQNVTTTDLQPYAPTAPGLPMAQYAVTCVMQWAQAQGFAGAIPTWEVGTNSDGQYVWGVTALLTHPDLWQITIPITSLSGFDPTNTISWGALVQTWATDAGYQLAIPTFQSDGTNVTALAFGSGYPTLSFYDAPNDQLYRAMLQPGTLCNLQDPAVWANSVMRVASNLGYGAGWPTWQWTQNRGLIGIPAFDYGPLPEANPGNVDHVLTMLKKTATMVQDAATQSLADYAGIYGTFTAPPIQDQGLAILMDCIFGALEIGLNLIPDVGGALSSLVSTALGAAQQAGAGSNGGASSFTLLQYQQALSASANATVNSISAIHDALLAAKPDPTTLAQVWAAPYADTLSGRTMSLGMLALAPKALDHEMTYWNLGRESVTSNLDQNLMQAITLQLYTLHYRTYPNRTAETQYWDGTIATVTAPGGPLDLYIDGPNADAENLSVWFSDFQQEEDLLHYYVTMTEWWLQVPTGGGVDAEYPPTEMVYALFSSDGFGTTDGWSGPFTQASAYTQWFFTQEQDAGSLTQTWTYPGGGSNNIVESTIANDDVINSSAYSLVAAYTDGYGNLTVSTDSRVAGFNSATGYSQPVIVNYLGYLGAS